MSFLVFLFWIFFHHKHHNFSYLLSISALKYDQNWKSYREKKISFIPLNTLKKYHIRKSIFRQKLNISKKREKNSRYWPGMVLLVFLMEGVTYQTLKCILTNFLEAWLSGVSNLVSRNFFLETYTSILIRNNSEYISISIGLL